MSVQTTLPLDWGRKNEDEFSVTVTVKKDERSVPPCPMHTHDCFEVLYIRTGERACLAAGRIYHLKAGDVLVIPPNVPHATPNLDTEIFDSVIYGYAESVVYTTENTLGSMKYLLPFHNVIDPERLLLSDESKYPELPTLRALLDEGAAVFRSHSLTRELDMRVNILRVHTLLYRFFLDAGGKMDEHFGEILCQLQDEIEAHLSEDLSPYLLAERLHVSHSHLCRLTKRAFGTTVTDLIRRFRVDRAERLLTGHPELSVTEIGLSVGFADTSYFIKCFRSLRGVTPNGLRASFAGTTGQNRR